VSLYQGRASLAGQPAVRSGDQVVITSSVDVVVVGAEPGYRTPDVVTVDLCHGQGPDGWLVSARDPQHPGVRLSIRVADPSDLTSAGARLVGR
jgi:hypothetical protein